MKKIIIYAHYYAPDVAATGQIIQDIAEELVRDFDVTVICTVPSYIGTIKEEYKKKKYYIEEINGVKLIRVSVPEFSKVSKFSRMRNLVAYLINARKATKIVGVQDYVFALSQPPIFGGVLGVYGKNKLRSSDGKHPKFIYNIQDFNPEQIEVVGYIKNKFVLYIAKWLDMRTCRKSDLIITVGRDLVETLRNRFKESIVPNYIMINNWADEDILYPLKPNDANVVAFKKQYGLIDKFVFMYSGNIGLYYDLERLISVIEKFKGAKTKDGQDVVFAFVGAGSLLKKLELYKKVHELENVVFIPYQDKERVIYSLNAADVHFCISLKGIKGVSCPSKFYGIVAVGKPIVAVLEKGSENEMLINEIGCGIISEPGNNKGIEDSIQWFIDHADDSITLDMGEKGRRFLENSLRKNISVDKYIRAIKRI